MLQAIRDRATGWIAYGIVGFLVIPFAFWGIDQYQGGGQIYVAEVGGIDIPLGEYQRALQEQQSRLQAMFGGQLDPDFFDQDQLKRDVLRRLVDQRLLTLVSQSEGYRIGDQELVQAVRQIPAFQSDGDFDQERYRVALQRQGMGPADFEARLRSEMSTAQLEGGVRASAFLTAADIDAVIRVRDQTREVASATLSLEKFQNEIEIGEAEIEDWFEENRAQFDAPERVKIEYIELDAADLGGDAEIQESDLLAYYEQQIERFVDEEERTASHILAPIAAAASADENEAARARIEAIHARLVSGEQSFEEAAAAASETPEGELEAGDLGIVVRGMLDPGLEAAIFELTETNEYSDPVRSDFGYHIVRLDSVEAGVTKPFEEVKEELRLELQADQGEGLFFEQAENLANLSYESPDSLQPAADMIGLEIKTSAWFDRLSGTGVAEDPRIREIAFADDVLLEGLNSEIVELTPTRAVVVRVLEHEAPRQRELEEVRDQVEASIREERAEREIAAAAESMLEALQNGASLETLAVEQGAEWSAPQMISRTQAETSRAVIEEIFRLPHPQPGSASFGVAQLESGDRAVLQVSEVKMAEPSDVEQEPRESLASSLRQQQSALEFSAVVDSLRDRTNIRLFPENL